MRIIITVQAAWTADDFAEHLDLPIAPLQRLVMSLVNQGYLTETNVDPPQFLPARDIATIRVAELLDDVRAADESRFLRKERIMPVTAVDEIIERMNKTRCDVLDDTTLRDLLDKAPPSA